MEVKKVVSVVSEFEMNVDKLQCYFDNLNVGLYDLSNDDDILPGALQDPNSNIETFKDKKTTLCECCQKKKKKSAL